VKTAVLLVGACCVALLGWLVVDVEADVRRAAFRIAELETRLGVLENENAWRRNRVAKQRVVAVDEARLKRAGLAVAKLPVRRIAAPAARRPGS
jgi:hypothetical protein